MKSRQYRQWLRAGVRMFDTRDSVLMPGESVSYMTMADLEAAAELCGLEWWRVAPAYRL